MHLTSIHDRMLAVYRGQMPDRIPVGVYDRYLPRGTVDREARHLGLGIIAYVPVVSMLGPPWHLYPGYLSEIRGAEFRVDYFWDGGVKVERRTYTTPLGAVWQEIIDDKAGMGSEHIRKHFITGRNDYRILAYLVEHTVVRRNEEAIRDRMRDLNGDGIVLGRLDRSPHQKCLIEWAGAERFLLDLYTDPEPALELMESLFRKQEESLVMALDSQVEVFWQPDNITSQMTPPAAYRQYCLPFYQRCTKLAHQAGKPYLIHMDGCLRALAPLIMESGFDVLESFSLPDIGGDMTLDEAQAAWPQIVVAPNIPANWALRSKAELVGLIEKLVDSAKPGVPLMLQISEDFPSSRLETFVSGVMHAMKTSPSPVYAEAANPPPPHNAYSQMSRKIEKRLRT